MNPKTDACIPCENCTRTGFPILFTRYGIAYSATAQGRAALDKLTPQAPLQPVPAMRTVSSNVRMLRAGYLYLYLESDYGNEWKGYAVHPHGYVSEFAVESPAGVKGHKACQRSSHAGNASLVWIEDAELVNAVWYLFSPDPIDYQHLQNVIKPQRAQYMQRFSTQQWLQGEQSQAHSTSASMLESQIFEYAALNDEKLQRCSDALLHGLMGSNAQERGWGDYEESVEYEKPSVNPSAALIGVTEADTMQLTRRQPGYASAHGLRLQQMKDFLLLHQGAVLACEDALGIAQELGHMQLEGQLLYTHWQLTQAKGHASGVSNEWVVQSAQGAISMHELIKKGAVQKVKDRQQMRARTALPPMVDALFERQLAMDAMQRRRAGDAEEDIVRDLQAQRAQHLREKELARQGERQRLNEKEIANAQKTGDAEFAQLFNQEGADKIFEEQADVKKNMQKVLDSLGADQAAWLQSSVFAQAMRCYSEQDGAIDKPGGGAALSLQLAQSLAGTESNAAGQTLLTQLDPFADNALSRLLSFNNEKLKQALKQADERAQRAAAMPKPEASQAWYDKLASILQSSAAQMELGDMALGFIAAAPEVSSSAKLRRLAWPVHVASLLSVKMIQGLNSLPARQIEAKILRAVALTGLSSLGSTAAEHAKTLVAADKSRLGNAHRKLLNAAHKGMSESALRGAPAARVAGLTGIFGIANAAANGFKLKAKRDTRSAMEMLQSLLQGTGSLLDYRAKAYEETIFKSAKGVNVFHGKAMQESMDRLNLLQLRRMRLAAFKFLLPAAVISAFFDIADAWSSGQRGQYGLSAAQIVGAFGTGFAIGGAAMTIFSWGSPALAAALGFIGSAFAVVAIVAVLVLSEPDWVNWLIDSPLSKDRKGQVPNHKNLQDSLQKLANAQAEI